MAKYSLEIKQFAQRELDPLDDSIFRRMDRKILALGRQSPAFGMRKPRGDEDQWRIRAGDWRVVYFVDDGAKIVTITRVAHRHEVSE